MVTSLFGKFVSFIIIENIVVYSNFFGLRFYVMYYGYGKLQWLSKDCLGGYVGRMGGVYDYGEGKGYKGCR